MTNPGILLCDESLSGLPVPTTLNAISFLKVVNGQLHIKTVIASHDSDFLIKTSDRIMLLKDVIIAMDINPQLHDSPIYFLKESH
jgi:ABC-type glutathione transport system ATPase component